MILFKKIASWLLALLCINSSCTAQKEEKIKKSYLNYKSDYKAVQMYDDFFNPQYADYLLNDKDLLAFLSKSVELDNSSEFSDVVVYSINKLKAEKTELTYIMLQKQGIKSIESMLELPYSLDMMLILHYNYLHEPYPLSYLNKTTQSYMKENRNLFFDFKQDVWGKVVQKALLRVNQLTKSQTETLLYLLAEFPLPLPEKEFNELVTHWEEFNPTFRNEIERIKSQRNQLAEQLKDFTDTIKVDFSNTDKKFEENKDWLRYLFALAGKKIVQGNDIQVEWLSQKTVLKEAERVYATKITTQKASRHWLVGATGINPKMDITYYEKEFKGTAPQIALHEFKVNVKQQGKSISEFTINEIITNQFFDTKTKQFVGLSENEVLTERTWLLGIALSYFTAEKRK